MMYTTYVIECINSNFCKVTKKRLSKWKRLFQTTILRLLNLKENENHKTIPNWSQVLNQLIMNEITPCIDKYLK